MVPIASSFPIYQVFAANTDLGKTIFSTALCRASIKTLKTYYLKPIQTGYPNDSDSRHVSLYSPDANSQVLYTYREPASPHLVAIQENRHVSDKELLEKTRKAINCMYDESNSEPSILFVETAGGISSPTMSGSLQCDAYRPLRLPVVLVGDSKLGGISVTISAYESLMIRGYDIACIILFRNDNCMNENMIRKHVPKSIPVYAVPPPPLQEKNPDLDHKQMLSYYSMLDPQFTKVVEGLLIAHEKRLTRLQMMGKEAKEKVWWPFTQHGIVQETMVIDSAFGDHFTTYQQTRNGVPSMVFDGCASWWTQCMGHGNVQLAKAAAYAAGRYGHVMFPEAVHEPALRLSEMLLEGVGAGWADRVFFSDDGSTAVEVALKMALKKSACDMNRNIRQGAPLEIFGTTGSYHGDTIGAMDAAYPNVYNEQVEWYSSRGYWFDPPTVVYTKGKYIVRLPEGMAVVKSELMFDSLDALFHSSRDNTTLARLYDEFIVASMTREREQGRYFGALIIEPVLQGAGGMTFIDPAFQRSLIRAARSCQFAPAPIPVIFDEVFVGFYRLGVLSATKLLGYTPDIACYAKCLTGGVLPLSVTLASEEVFKCFMGDSKVSALLHGHSYTAHPMGCQVAIETLLEYERRNLKDGRLTKIWNSKIVDELANLPNVDGVVALGTVLAVELPADSKGYTSTESQDVVRSLRKQGVFARPLGNVVYIMGSQTTEKEEFDRIANLLLQSIRKQ